MGEGRKEMKTPKTAFVVLGWMMISVASLQAEEKGPDPAAVDLPAPVAKNLEGRKGLCLDLGCGDGKLAVAIVRKSELYVLAIAKDDKDCAITRTTLDKADIYGKRAIAVTGSLTNIPLANNYANLIVTGDYQEGLNLKEVFRVLNPHGVAVIGGAKANAAKLKEQAANAGITGVKIEGNYLIFQGKMPPGADDWGHFRRRPDNNPVSQDASIRPPFRTQWISTSGRLAAQGRVIQKVSKELSVLDGFNGIPLWQLPMKKPDGSSYHRTPYYDTVATGERLYTVDGPVIRELDAASGKELRTFEAARDSEAAGASFMRLDVVDGVLYAQANAEKLTGYPGFNWGNIFLAFNLKDGRCLWSYKAPKSASAVAFGDGAMYFYVQETGAFAVDIKTGQERWKNTTDVPYPGTSKEAPISAIYYDGMVGFYLGPNNASTKAWNKVLDTKTGKLIYTLPDGRAPLFIDNKVYLAGGYSTSGADVFDAKTGAKLATVPEFRGYRCVVATASVKCLFTHVWMAKAVDMETKKAFYFDAYRNECPQGAQVANGLVYHIGGFSDWNDPMDGGVAVAPAPAWVPPDVLKDAAYRLRKGPAYETPLVEESDAKNDWPCYRHDTKHTCCTPGEVKPAGKKEWKTALSGTLASPTVAGDILVTASSDGYIWGIDVATGAIKWKYMTGGDIPVSPMIWKGRVLAGSRDGWVYCLKVATGELAWAFRAAPEERYLHVMGKMVSQWPVQTGVAVEDDTAYVVAGLCVYDGAYMYALNVQTGAVLWSKKEGHEIRADDVSAISFFGGLGMNPYGPLTIAGDLLIVPNGGGTTSAFKKKDGETFWRRQELTSWGGWGGPEVVTDGEILLQSGNRPLGKAAGAGAIAMDIRNANTAKPYLPILSFEGTSTHEAPRDIARCVPTLAVGTVYHCILDPKGKGFAVRAYDRKKLLASCVAEKKAVYTHATPAGAIIWTASNVPAKAHTVVATAASLVVVGENEVAVLNTADQTEKSRFKVAEKIAPNGVAVAGGRIFVATEQSTINCLNP